MNLTLHLKKINMLIFCFPFFFNPSDIPPDEEFFTRPKSFSQTPNQLSQQPTSQTLSTTCKNASQKLGQNGLDQASKIVGSVGLNSLATDESNRASRKRDMYEMFGIMSDSESENELVIDAPSPVKGIHLHKFFRTLELSVVMYQI